MGFHDPLCHISALLFLKKFSAPSLGLLIRKVVPGCSAVRRQGNASDVLGLFQQGPHLQVSVLGIYN